MKRIFKSIMFIAVAAMTLYSCSKESTETPEVPEENGMVTLKFNIKNADKTNITKALLGSENGKNFLKWENGDKIGTFSTGTFSDEHVSNNNPGTVAVNGDNYTLNVQTYKAGNITNICSYFPHSASAGKNKTAAIVTIPEFQIMDANGFDADAMPMAGEPIDVTLTTANPNEDTPCGTINFSNLGSIIKFRIYSSTATEETLTSVKYVTAGNVGGTFSIDLTGIDSDDETTLALTASDPVSSITTNYQTKPVIGNGYDNAIDVYMVVAPGTYANTQVIVTTNAHTYTLTASGAKTYTRSHVKPMNVDIQNGEVGDLPQAETWTKVTNAADFTAGTYYILRGDGAYYLPNALATNGAPACISFTAGGTISNAMKWTATEGEDGLIFESVAHEGNFLWGSNSNNGVRVNTTSTAGGASKEWKFTTTKVGEITYYTAYAYATRYLTSYGDQDWRNYTSASATNIPAEFYKLSDNTPRFSIVSPLEVNASEDTYTVSVTRSNFTGVINISVPDGCNWIDADDYIPANENTFEILVSANTGSVRTATLTLSGTGVASQTLVVNQAGEPAPESLPYSNTLLGSHTGFTINNISTGSLTEIWKDNSSYGITANANHTESNVESYLESPYIDLRSVSDAQLKFSHGINYFADVATAKSQATLQVRVKNGAWTNVTIPTYPETLGNGFVEAKVSLLSYVGNIIQFRFKYLATSSNPGRWQIKNLSVEEAVPVVLSSISVSGQKTSFVKNETFSFGGTVTATYSDNTTADVTDEATFSDYNMSTAGSQTVTVSYTEGEITKTTTYNITVSDPETLSLKYTLDGTITATGNAYASASSVTQGGINWDVTANTEQNPWRVGGKGITDEDRVICSKTAISSNISKITVESGATASNLTVNSVTISVHNNATDAASGSNAIATKTFTSDIASSTITFDKEGSTSWANKYYRIVYNVTRTSTSGNGYITFVNAKFYGTN